MNAFILQPRTLDEPVRTALAELNEHGFTHITGRFNGSDDECDTYLLRLEPGSVSLNASELSAEAISALEEHAYESMPGGLEVGIGYVGTFRLNIPDGAVHITAQHPNERDYYDDQGGGSGRYSDE